MLYVFVIILGCGMLRNVLNLFNEIILCVNDFLFDVFYYGRLI